MSILDGFGDMRDLNTFSAFEIGDGEGTFEQAVTGAGGESQLLNSSATRDFTCSGATQ